MKTSCVTHPANERLVIIRKWQVEFCEGNQCAAALLSFFEYWHSWKIETDRYNHKSNNVAEMHGESRLLSEDVYQYHSLQEMSDGILNLYGAKSISEAIKFLEFKNVITTHGNPNPRFHYDKTKYFQFYPDVCNEWLKSSYESRSSKNAVSKENKCASDLAKIPHASGENTLPSRKNALPITEINNKENNQSIKPHKIFNVEKQKTVLDMEGRDETRAIVVALIKKGMPQKRFYPDSLIEVDHLIRLGATESMFLEAYDLALRCTQGNDFGVNYLAKVVEDLLAKFKKPIVNRSTFQPQINKDNFNETVYESDFSNAPQWLKESVADASKN